LFCIEFLNSVNTVFYIKFLHT